MKRRLVLAAALWLSVSPPATASTLFEDLGGLEGVTRIANDMLDLSLADPRIKDAFSETNLDRLRLLLAEHFCELTGGPCKYTGRSMRRAHAPFELRQVHFNALTENVQTAMERLKVPFSAQNRLLALLAPIQREIITR